MEWLIPFEKMSTFPWTYSMLLVWYIFACCAFLIGAGFTADLYTKTNNRVYLLIGGMSGVLIYWWLTWSLGGKPVFGVLEILSQPVK